MSNERAREEKEHLARFMLRLKHERNIAMLWIEYDMEMVMDLADSMVVLDYGQVIAAGSPESVSSDDRVITAFLGVPAE